LNNYEYTSYILRKYSNDDHYNEDRFIGLKRWIIERLGFVCTNYKLDCSYAQEYLGDDFKYEVNMVSLEEKNGGCRNFGYYCCILDTTPVQTTDSVGQ